MRRDRKYLVCFNCMRAAAEHGLKMRTDVTKIKFRMDAYGCTERTKCYNQPHVNFKKLVKYTGVGPSFMEETRPKICQCGQDFKSGAYLEFNNNKWDYKCSECYNKE